MEKIEGSDRPFKKINLLLRPKTRNGNDEILNSRADTNELLQLSDDKE